MWKFVYIIIHSGWNFARIFIKNRVNSNQITAFEWTVVPYTGGRGWVHKYFGGSGVCRLHNSARTLSLLSDPKGEILKFHKYNLSSHNVVNEDVWKYLYNNDKSIVLSIYVVWHYKSHTLLNTGNCCWSDLKSTAKCLGLNCLLMKRHLYCPFKSQPNKKCSVTVKR